MGTMAWDEDYDSCIGLFNRGFLSYFTFISSLTLSTNAAKRGEIGSQKMIETKMDLFFFCIFIAERDGVVGFITCMDA